MDEHEFDDFYVASFRRVTGQVYAMIGNLDEAQECVQEAFVRAHVRWRRIRRYDDPVGWIRRVAVNLLRDDHHRQQRKAVAERRLANERPTTFEPDVDETLALLSSLPRQQRLAVALFYVDGLSVAEVATAMRLSEGAEKFHLHQGRAKLRERLNRE